MEKVLGYIFEGLIPNSWPSNAFWSMARGFIRTPAAIPSIRRLSATTFWTSSFMTRPASACGGLFAGGGNDCAKRTVGEIYIFKNNTDSLGNTTGVETFSCAVTWISESDRAAHSLRHPAGLRGAGKVLKVSGKPSFHLPAGQHIHEKLPPRPLSAVSSIRATPRRCRTLSAVIIRDSNMSELVTYLKVGTATLVLSMIEEGFSAWDGTGRPGQGDLRFRDPTVKRKIKLDDGRQMTAVEIQRVYLERAQVPGPAGP
jgi:proteasome accessory factor A